MRISDWSSDVCSSDLIFGEGVRQQADLARRVILPEREGELRQSGLLFLRLHRRFHAAPDEQLRSIRTRPLPARAAHKHHRRRALYPPEQEEQKGSGVGQRWCRRVNLGGKGKRKKKKT